MPGQSSPDNHAQSLGYSTVHVSDQAQSGPVVNTSIRPHHIQPTPVVIPHTVENQPDASVSVMHLRGAPNQAGGSSEKLADNYTARQGVERTPETPVSVGGSDVYSAGVAYFNADEVQDCDRDQTSNLRGDGENEQHYNTQDGWASQRRSSCYSPSDHSPPPPATSHEFNNRNDRYPQHSPALHSPPLEHHPLPMVGRKRARDSDEWFGTETSYRPRRLRPDESDRNIERGWRGERPPSPRWHPPAATRRRSPTPEWRRRHDDEQHFRRSPSPGRQRVIYRRQVSPISPHRADAFPPHPRITRPEGASRIPPKASSSYRPSYQDNEDMGFSETRDPRVRLQEKGGWTSETQTYTPRYRQDTEDIVESLPPHDDDLGGDHASLLSRMSDTQQPLQTFTHQRGTANRGRGRGRLSLMSRLSSVEATNDARTF
ncbi:hypothetical protein SERLA73DRAFT_180222 [Serpula lacrymans var. lacrymans S7.3]|uniref:Uncharacterized protein n=2 Tax=Serpula lacrymans var. lacrymans TaxID=341189 RepID=F8PWA9_SERL3|nr:uncharacterized protein SERLADRAFT_465730 [Serpula lacrymans var. lacrymans S7.9]EGN99914.1 hypothetical protein SERLA73DRAFT_180222 [Serpula lacrymans var. lacrymans S7.3]EGO25482.1 hypothetical protein SERLADRAFT_465730 [Serpula lacrymans var. lacrymans S7.9]